MVEHTTSAPEFDEIPREWRENLDREVRAEAFEVLHAEAVARNELPPAPRTWFDRLPGRSLVTSFQILMGAVMGIFAVIAIIQIMRTFRTVN